MSDDVKPVIKQEMLDDELQSGSPAILPSVLQLVKQELGTLKMEGDCSIRKLVISEPCGVSKFEVIPLCSNQTSDNDHTGAPALSEVPNSASNGGLPVEDACLNSAPQFICELCNFISKSKRGLGIHVSSKHKKQKHGQYVEECGGQFDRQFLLTRHTRLVHRLPEACHICGNVVKYLKEHIRNVHTQVKVHTKLKQPHKCEICGENFPYRYKLKRHMRRHTNTRPFACSRCKYAAYDKKELSRHFQRTHESSRIAAKRQFKCNTCGKVFLTNQYLKVHTDVVHKGLKRFSCSYCDYKSYDRHYLKSHEAQIHCRDANKERFDCEICGKVFSWHNGLVKHKRNVHLSAKRFLCPYCEFSTFSELLFDVHKRKDHIDELDKDESKLFFCYNCSKKFQNEMDKDLHMFSKVCWKTEKRFSCTSCNKRYASKYSLNCHIKRFHPNSSS